jgi:transcriptional regulator with XRE-family HTH domain
MKPELHSPLRANLDRLRIQKEWDRTELARKAGVSLPYVSQLLSGKRTNPRIAILRKLAKALGTTVAELQREPDEADRVAAAS